MQQNKSSKHKKCDITTPLLFITSGAWNVTFYLVHQIDIVYEHSTMSLLDVFLGIVFLSLKLDTTFFFKFNKKFKARQWKFFFFF